jgi:hypothetical protein
MEFPAIYTFLRKFLSFDQTAEYFLKYCKGNYEIKE